MIIYFNKKCISSSASTENCIVIHGKNVIIKRMFSSVNVALKILLSHWSNHCNTIKNWSSRSTTYTTPYKCIFMPFLEHYIEKIPYDKYLYKCLIDLICIAFMSSSVPLKMKHFLFFIVSLKMKRFLKWKQHHFYFFMSLTLVVSLNYLTKQY